MSSHPVDIHVGKRLRLRRTLLGMSQESVGSAIGVTFQQIQKYERGINRMGASRLFDFAKALGVNVSYFFEGYEDPAASKQFGGKEENPDAFEYDRFSSRDTMELVRNYNRLPTSKLKKTVSDLVKAVADDNVVTSEAS